MKIVRLLVAAILGLVCAFIASSVLASAASPLNIYDIAAAGMVLAASVALIWFSTSSPKQRPRVFIVCAILLALVGGLFQLAYEMPPSLEAQFPDLSESELSSISLLYEEGKAQGSYSMKFAGILFLIGLVLAPYLSKKIPKSE